MQYMCLWWMACIKSEWLDAELSAFSKLNLQRKTGGDGKEVTLRLATATGAGEHLSTLAECDRLITEALRRLNASSAKAAHDANEFGALASQLSERIVQVYATTYSLARYQHIQPTLSLPAYITYSCLLWALATRSSVAAATDSGGAAGERRQPRMRPHHQSPPAGRLPDLGHFIRKTSSESGPRSSLAPAAASSNGEDVLDTFVCLTYGIAQRLRGPYANVLEWKEVDGAVASLNRDTSATSLLDLLWKEAERVFMVLRTRKFRRTDEARHASRQLQDAKMTHVATLVAIAAEQDSDDRRLCGMLESLARTHFSVRQQVRLLQEMRAAPLPENTRTLQAWWAGQVSEIAKYEFDVEQGAAFSQFVVGMFLCGGATLSFLQPLPVRPAHAPEIPAARMINDLVPRDCLERLLAPTRGDLRGVAARPPVTPPLGGESGGGGVTGGREAPPREVPPQYRDLLVMCMYGWHMDGIYGGSWLRRYVMGPGRVDAEAARLRETRDPVTGRRRRPLVAWLMGQWHVCSTSRERIPCDSAAQAVAVWHALVLRDFEGLLENDNRPISGVPQPSPDA